MPDSANQHQRSKSRTTSETAVPAATIGVETAPPAPAAMASASLSSPLGNSEEGQSNNTGENCGIDLPATQDKNAGKTSDSKSDFVTYVIVVHGMGSQRKNETVISVVNRFAEARHGPHKKDKRDVLSLGQASKQTGVSKVSKNKQPWMEFEGIPADAKCCLDGVFLGAESSTGKNLRFVDLWWADILRDSFKHVGQDTEVWTKSLLGRLLRKHDGAKDNYCTQVPFWIRRVLFLLADTLLLVRFAMNFRFKEMKELVFVKYLGDVQVYGEYDRCRGRAVRRFHKMMAKIEAEHYSRENGRKVKRDPRYVVIAHSLGSIMSFDALLYAHAKPSIRRSDKVKWAFPGYYRAKDIGNEPNTNWIWRVESFVTLGSPIDKFLMLWWFNYRYLLNHNEWFERTGSKIQTCHCLGQRRKPPINHFNYCDELDPVGHNLDVAKQTKAYNAVFESKEDIVFNRYTVPGAAHNGYWGDQGLFKWILARAVDKPVEDPDPPDWFDHKAYRKLLSRIYNWVPRAVVASTFFTVSVALLAEKWHTVVTSAVIFAVVVLLGRRLIDLSIWWRQIQRKESCKMWTDLGNCEQKVDDWPLDVPDGKRQCVKKKMKELAKNRDKKAKRSGCWIRCSPWPWMVATAFFTWCWFELNDGQKWLIDFRSSIEPLLACISEVTGCASPSQDFFRALVEGWVGRLAMFMVMSGLVVLAYGRFLVLPDAFRTPASTRDDYCAERCTAFFAILPVVAGWFLYCFCPAPWSHWFANYDFIMGHLILLSFLATMAYTYRWQRYEVVKKKLGPGPLPSINYDVYANHA